MRVCPNVLTSILENSGATLLDIGALLGHSNIVTAHRYAHLIDDRKGALAAVVGEFVTTARKPAGAEVIAAAWRSQAAGKLKRRSRSAGMSFSKGLLYGDDPRVFKEALATICVGSGNFSEQA